MFANLLHFIELARQKALGDDLPRREESHRAAEAVLMEKEVSTVKVQSRPAQPQTKAAKLALPPVPKTKAAALALYGNPGNGKAPDPGFKDRLVRVQLPYPMRLAWDLDTKVNSILIHKYAVDIVQILQDVYNRARLMVKEEHGFKGTTEFYNEKTLEKLQSLGLDLFGGSYNHRLKRGGTTLSAHAYAVAIDLDPAHNAMGQKNYKMPEWVIQAFESYGWTAGARWSGKYVDAMHFQRADVL